MIMIAGWWKIYEEENKIGWDRGWKTKLDFVFVEVLRCNTSSALVNPFGYEL